MINLKKDERINLSKEIGATKVRVGLGWTGRRGSVDLDSYVATFDAEGNRTDFIYFGNLTTMGIKHHGDDLVGGGRATDPNESIDIDLSALGSDVAKVVIGVVDYGGKGLFRVKDSFLNIEQDGKEVLRADLGEYPKSMGVVAGLFQKRGDEWYFVNKSISSALKMNGLTRAKTFSALTVVGEVENSSSGSSSSSESSSSGGGFFSRLFS